MDPQTSRLVLVAPGPSLSLLRGHDRRTLVADLADELTARRDESLELVDACLPLAHRLHFGAMCIGPEMSQTAIQLIARLERHARRQGPGDAA